MLTCAWSFYYKPEGICRNWNTFRAVASVRKFSRCENTNDNSRRERASTSENEQEWSDRFLDYFWLEQFYLKTETNPLSTRIGWTPHLDPSKLYRTSIFCQIDIVILPSFVVAFQFCYAVIQRSLLSPMYCTCFHRSLWDCRRLSLFICI